MSTLSVLGEMVWLYSHSRIHREWAVGSIQQWLVPAIIHKQFRIYRNQGKPHSFVTWAWLSKEIEENYVRNTSTLQPNHWNAGDRLWFIDWIAPFGGTAAMSRDLKTNLFAEEVGRFLRIRKGDDTLRIFYVHGSRALEKARDRDRNPTVELSPGAT